MKRGLILFFVIIMCGKTNVMAYDCAFSSAEFFIPDETENDGLWLWQLYAAEDECYIDADKFSDGRRYLSSSAAESLPSGKDQRFYGVKAFLVPYSSDLTIKLKNTVSGDGVSNVGFRIVRNDGQIFPQSGEWATAEMLNEAEKIETEVCEGDTVRFIAAPLTEKPGSNFEIIWNTEVILQSSSRYLKNSNIDIYGSETRYEAAEGFSDIQGENNWTYRCRKTADGTEYNESVYSETDKAWKNASDNNRGQIGADFMLPGIEPKVSYDVMRVFNAPIDGTVTISAKGDIKAQNSEISDAFGVKIRITQNGETIYPSDGDWEYLDSRDAVIGFTDMVINVSEGDLISFETARTINCAQPAQMRRNILYWNPIVKYEKVAEVKFDFANYFDEEAGFVPVIAIYDESGLQDIKILDKVHLSRGSRIRNNLSFIFSGCTKIKIFLLNSLTELQPADNAAELNYQSREVK